MSNKRSGAREQVFPHTSNPFTLASVHFASWLTIREGKGGKLIVQCVLVKSLTLFTRYREAVQDNCLSDDSEQEENDTKPTEMDSDDEDNKDDD